MSDYKYIIRVIMSCKTEDQLEACSNWIEKVKIKTEGDCWHYLNLKLDLKQIINEQRLYINRLGEVC